MIAIETATVYRGGGRRYFTKRAACDAEARAIIKKRYPSEPADFIDGQQVSAGWYWRDLPNADKLLRRMTRLVRAASSPKTENP